MNSNVKFVIGILMVLVGVYLLLPRSWLLDFGLPAFGYGRFLLPVLQGVIPLFLVIVGFMLAWIMWEEMEQERNRKKVQ